MAFSVASCIPDELTKGDAYSFTVTDSDHPAGTWSSVLYLKNDSGTVVNLAGSASGTDHLFALTNTFTGTLTVGRNLVCVSFSDGTHRQTSDWKELQVLADPSVADPVSFAAQMVAALQTSALSLAGKTSGSISVDGVSIAWGNQDQYDKFLTKYQAAVINEKRQADAARGIAQNRIVSQFVCR